MGCKHEHIFYPNKKHGSQIIEDAYKFDPWNSQRWSCILQGEHGELDKVVWESLKGYKKHHNPKYYTNGDVCNTLEFNDAI